MEMIQKYLDKKAKEIFKLKTTGHYLLMIKRCNEFIGIARQNNLNVKQECEKRGLPYKEVEE